jgi:hypothetical protein
LGTTDGRKDRTDGSRTDRHFWADLNQYGFLKMGGTEWMGWNLYPLALLEGEVKKKVKKVVITMVQLLICVAHQNFLKNSSWKGLKKLKAYIMLTLPTHHNMALNQNIALLLRVSLFNLLSQGPLIKAIFA